MRACAKYFVELFVLGSCKRIAGSFSDIYMTFERVNESVFSTTVNF